MLILKLALLNLDDNHHLMSSFHGLYEISLVMHIHDTTTLGACVSITPASTRLAPDGERGEVMVSSS
jgi:hypothetical protein